MGNWIRQAKMLSLVWAVWKIDSVDIVTKLCFKFANMFLEKLQIVYLSWDLFTNLFFEECDMVAEFEIALVKALI